MLNSPKGFTLNALHWFDSKIMLLGVQKRSFEHSIYLYQFLTQFDPEYVVAQIQSDHPVMIAGEYWEDSWLQFIKQGKGDFLCNPWPDTAYETLLNGEKLDQLFHQNFLASSQNYFYSGMDIAYSVDLKEKLQQTAVNPQHYPDAIWTAAQWCYNNQGLNKILSIGDMPELVYRERAVRKIKIDRMKKLFSEFAKGQSQDQYDFRFRNSELFLVPKAVYLSELTKQLAKQPVRIAVVCEEYLIEYILEYWQYMGKESTNLKQLFKIPDFKQEETFLDFIEKHCILDLLLEPWITYFYTRHYSFPFSLFGTKGINTFSFPVTVEAWKHFDNIYKSKLNS